MTIFKYQYLLNRIKNNIEINKLIKNRLAGKITNPNIININGVPELDCDPAIDMGTMMPKYKIKMTSHIK